MANGLRMEISNIGTLEDVRTVIRKVEQNRASSTHLDLSNLGGASAKRTSRTWGAVFANVLLSQLGHRRFSVTLPSTDNGRSQLARSGVIFALSQRDRRLTEFAASDLSMVERWRTDWTPTDRAFVDRLLYGADEVDSPLEVQHNRFVTFINPHHRTTNETLVREVAHGQAMPWATKLISRIGHGLTETARRDLIDAVSGVVTELVWNVGHAFVAQVGRNGVIPPNRRRSYVQVYATDGGGAASYNRLHIVVCDVGHGIARTLRPKLAAQDSHYSEIEERRGSGVGDDRVVEMLLGQRLPSFGQASGVGYRRITSILADFGGTLDLVTGSLDQVGVSSTVIATMAVHEGSREVEARLEQTVAFAGTYCHATVPLHPRRRSTA